MRNTSPVNLVVLDGCLRITLKKRATARIEVRDSIEYNGHEAALREILGLYYTRNNIFCWVDPRHLGHLSGPALAHPDDYSVDYYGNLVYLRHVYSYIAARDPLEVLLEQGYVEFVSHTLDVMRSREWVKLRYSLYNHLYSVEFIKDVEKASEIQSDGVILIEAFPDGSDARSFWAAGPFAAEHSKPGSLFAVVKPIDAATYDFILNSDLTRETREIGGPRWRGEDYPDMRAQANEMLRQHRMAAHCQKIRDIVIETFNVVEAHETDLEY